MMKRHSKEPETDQEAAIDSSSASLTRRGFFRGAGAAGLAAVSPVALGAESGTDAADGTPEQIHLTWGDATASSVVVSWASAGQSVNPRVVCSHGAGRQHAVPAVQRTYTDGLNGQTVFTWHAQLRDLPPGAAIRYLVTADNDSQFAAPFQATFQTAPKGRKPFRWTSYGDLATPVTSWVLSSLQSNTSPDTRCRTTARDSRAAGTASAWAPPCSSRCRPTM
jgi:hypothetical protein